MKAVLISIQPKWCELIASGKKTVEVRKTKPKIDVPFKVYIYCTKDKNHSFCTDDGNQYTHIGNGKVIGEFVCDCIGEYWFTQRDNDIEEYEDVQMSCLSAKEIIDYGCEKELYFWYISNLVIYDEPKNLSEFYQKCKSYDKDEWENDDCLECENLCGNGGKLYLKRPPQSWCYVDERSEK